MIDLTIRDKHAASALDRVAQHDAEPASNHLARRCHIRHAIDDAMAAGVAHFQASVAAGSSPRAMPHDGACAVLVALHTAGFKVVRDPKRK